MHRILVEEKRWIGENRFLHALNYCMLLPGPEAQQLATYIGWLMHRTPRRRSSPACCSSLPGVVSIMALSCIYALFGKVGIVSALFFGLKAAVLAVVLAGRGADRQAGAQEPGHARARRRGLRRDLLLRRARSRSSCSAAGLIGFFGGRAGLPPFQVGGGHGPAEGGAVADADALLGEELPAHARPTVARALRVAGVCLALWLVPVAALLATLGPDNVFSQIADLLLRPWRS